MFKNGFQGGASFEVLSSQGTAQSLSNWKIHHKGFVKRLYEKELKGYCHSCENLGKLTLPKDDKQSAYLIQPILVLQMYSSVGQPLSIELCMTDLTHNHRRFFISTFQKEVKMTAFHCAIPITNLKRGVWMNLCIDLVSLLSDNFKGQAFRSLDSISLLGTFRIRRVFTLKRPPPDTTGDDYGEPNMPFNTEPIPKALQFPVGVPHFNQVLNMSRLVYLLQGASRPTRPTPLPESHSPLPNVAFGRTIESHKAQPVVHKSKPPPVLPPIEEHRTTNKKQIPSVSQQPRVVDKHPESHPVFSKAASPLPQIHKNPIEPIQHEVSTILEQKSTERHIELSVNPPTKKPHKNAVFNDDPWKINEVDLKGWNTEPIEDPTGRERMTFYDPEAYTDHPESEANNSVSFEEAKTNNNQDDDPKSKVFEAMPSECREISPAELLNKEIDEFLRKSSMGQQFDSLPSQTLEEDDDETPCFTTPSISGFGRNVSAGVEELKIDPAKPDHSLEFKIQQLTQTESVLVEHVEADAISKQISEESGHQPQETASDTIEESTTSADEYASDNDDLAARNSEHKDSMKPVESQQQDIDRVNSGKNGSLQNKGYQNGSNDVTINLASVRVAPAAETSSRYLSTTTSSNVFNNTEDSKGGRLGMMPNMDAIPKDDYEFHDPAHLVFQSSKSENGDGTLTLPSARELRIGSVIEPLKVLEMPVAPKAILEEDTTNIEHEVEKLIIYDENGVEKQISIELSSNDSSIDGEHDDQNVEDDETIELVYDPDLKCYKDPKTGKYYDVEEDE